MIMQQYHDTCYKLVKRLTISYSTSFSWGIKAFSPEFRNPIYSIYGYVRVADEIVDTFHNFDKEYLLKKFRDDTWEAIESGISTNPVLHSFQEVVNKYNIDHKLIEAFLNSMEMDLENSYYERNKYDNYIYGSAEAVGLMCLKVFVNGDQKKYDELEYSARMLGAAFQKVNFLRDIKSDIVERGRIYLPGIDHKELINNLNKQKLEAEVEKEFHLALAGIKNLPVGVKFGVYSAYLYYIVLLKKIKRLDVDELLQKRVRVSNLQKLILLFKSYLEVKFLRTT